MLCYYHYSNIFNSKGINQLWTYQKTESMLYQAQQGFIKEGLQLLDDPDISPQDILDQINTARKRPSQNYFGNQFRTPTEIVKLIYAQNIELLNPLLVTDRGRTGEIKFDLKRGSDQMGKELVEFYLDNLVDNTPYNPTDAIIKKSLSSYAEGFTNDTSSGKKTLSILNEVLISNDPLSYDITYEALREYQNVVNISLQDSNLSKDEMRYVKVEDRELKRRY